MIRTLVILAFAAACDPAPHTRRVSAENIIVCRERCQERFFVDGAPRPDIVPAIEAWKRGDRGASDRMWEEIFAVELTCESKCDAMKIGARQ